MPETFARFPQRSLVVAVSCTAVAIVWANTTSLLASVPAIGHDLNASQTQLQWAGDIYPLVIATLLLPAGTLLDRFGRKRGLVLGLVLLLVGDLGCGVAETPGMLIVARSFCAVGAALVYPATLATLSSFLRGSEQHR